MNYDKLYNDLDKSIPGKWYWLHTNQYGKDVMTDVIKLKIDNGGDFEFNNEYTKFRKNIPFDPKIKIIMEQHDGRITEIVEADFRKSNDYSGTRNGARK